MERLSIVETESTVSRDLPGERRRTGGICNRAYSPRLQEEILMSEFRRARARIQLSPGESVRIMRELQELSQNDLAEATGIPQSTISAIERQRINLGVERAKVLARALKCHPAVLVFPGWDADEESAA